MGEIFFESLFWDVIVWWISILCWNYQFCYWLEIQELFHRKLWKEVSACRRRGTNKRDQKTFKPRVSIILSLCRWGSKMNSVLLISPALCLRPKAFSCYTITIIRFARIPFWPPARWSRQGPTSLPDALRQARATASRQC